MAFNFASSQSFFAQSQPQSSSLFGAQSQPSIFSQPTPNSLFQTSPIAGSASAPSLFSQPQSSSSLFATQTQNVPQPQQPPPTLPSTLVQLVESLNPLHPSSPFQAALYNVVPPAVLPRYTKPPTMHPALWQAALSANPDPSRQVPVPANGFEDLHKRARTQSERLDDHSAVLTRLQTETNTIQNDINTNVTTKLAAYRRRHRELARKLLRVAATVEAAAARTDTSGVLSVVEVERRKRLENVARALSAPAEFKDKLSDLVEVSGATLLDRSTVVPVVMRDSKAANAVRQLLADQLKGIEHLGTVCTKIDRDVAIINNVMQQR